MSIERSDRIYLTYLEASQKFDYFVAGVGLALVGYLGARFEAVPIGWNPSTIELGAIAALLASAVAGLKRIETNVTLLGVMHKRLYEEEAAGALTGAAGGGGPGLNKATGEVLSLAELLYKAKYHEVGAEVIAETLRELARWSVFWYRARNTLLLLGLGLLVLGRIAIGYAL